MKNQDPKSLSESQKRLLKFVGAGFASLTVWAMLGSLPHSQRSLGAIFVLAVCLWVTEALPLAVTALISTALLILFGVTSAEKAFSAFGDPIVLLFIGSFIQARAMSVSGLDKRLAFNLLRHEWATSTPARLLLSVGVMSSTLGLFASSTAVAAMMIPICLSVLRAIGSDKPGTPFATGLLMMAAWSATISVGTILGKPPNLIGVSLIDHVVGYRIGFVQWMLFGMPITIVLLVSLWLLLWSLYARNVPKAENASVYARQELHILGRMSPMERNTMAAFFITLFLWLLPGILSMILGADSSLAMLVNERLTPAVAALLGAFLLFLLPTGKESNQATLTWSQAATIDWGTIILLAGGIALGTAMFDTGLAQTIGQQLALSFHAKNLWGITAFSTGLANVVSEFSSNTSSATTIVPVAIGLSNSVGISPMAPALGATLGASMGFMLPVSTPPNAIIYGSGLVPAAKMMRTGFLVDLIGFATIYLLLRIILPLIGLSHVPLR